ncbi:MAG TPA: tetratricopeptide repeat protein [Ktedonobacteraceae bacterium]
MKESSSFGALLKRYRLEAGLSQEALAARAQLSTRGISDLERGVKQTPRFDTLNLLSGALSLSEQQRALFLAAARPELKTPVAVPSASAPIRVPLPPTRLIGREQERSHALALLQGVDVRLLTITGPGGVGKTRLALQFAHDLSTHFTDGVAFVALASVLDAAFVPATIAEALGLREEADSSPEKQVCDFLSARHFLLVLDNFEHLMEAASFVADVLATCPHVSILVTSRMPLRLRAEHIFPLAPLMDNDAVKLFQARAQAVRPGGTYEVAAVSAICERLDRLPLAIELAAMQIRVLSLPELLERLTHRLSLLHEGGRDLPERQQTMRRAIAWSYELLTKPQQRCFRALGVFVGGWAFPAVHPIGFADGEIGPDDVLLLLAALVDASLVQVNMPSQGVTRFEMLELMREYALERLQAAGEEEACRRRHAAYYAQLGETIGPFGPVEEADWLRLVQEFPNVHAALQWAQARREAMLGLRLATAFGRFWVSRGQMSEAEFWYERMLALDGLAGGQEARYVLRAEALMGLGQVLLNLGKMERAEAAAKEGLRRSVPGGDHSGMSAAYAILGQIAQMRGRVDEAATFFVKSDEHAKRSGIESLLGMASRNLANLALMQGDYVRATALFEERLASARSSGVVWVVANITTLLGYLAGSQQNYPLAKARYREALALFRSFGNPTYTAWCLEGLAATLCAEGQYAQAVHLCAASAAMRAQARTPLPSTERAAFEHAVASAKAALGDSAFEEEWHIGSDLIRDEAIDYALSEACT